MGVRKANSSLTRELEEFPQMKVDLPSNQPNTHTQGQTMVKRSWIFRRFTEQFGLTPTKRWMDLAFHGIRFHQAIFPWRGISLIATFWN